LLAPPAENTRLKVMSPYPAVFTGNLNFPEGTELYEDIQATSMADSKFLASEVLPYGTINYFLPNVDDLGILIDFIFVQPEHFNVLKYEVDYSRKI